MGIKMNEVTNEKNVSVKLNSLFNIFAKLIWYLAPLIISPYISRVLMPEGVGQFSYANTIAIYFTLFIEFGFCNYGTKEISIHRESKEEYSKTFWSIFCSRILLTTIALIVYSSLVFGNALSSVASTLIFVCLFPFILASLFNIDFLFQGLERFKTLSFIMSFCRLCSIVAVFLFVKSPDDLYVYCLIASGVSFANVLLQWCFAWKLITKPHIKDISIWKSLRSSVVYFIPTVAISIYTMLDKTMIASIAGNTENGYYEQASKITNVATNLIFAIYPVILSRISFLTSQKDKEAIDQKFVQLAQIQGLLAFPSILGIYAVGQYFVPAFFGESFTPSISILYWIAPVIFIGSVSGAMQSAYFIPNGKLRTMTIIYFIGAFTNFGLNFIFIKKWGAVGAAITTLISESIISLLMILLAHKEIPYKAILKAYIKPFIAAIIMFLVIFVLNYFCLSKTNLNNVYLAVIEIAIGIVVYGICVVFLKEPMVCSTLKTIKTKILKKVN